MRGVPGTFIKCLSILDVVIVINTNGITIPFFNAAAVGIFNFDCIIYTLLLELFFRINERI